MTILMTIVHHHEMNQEEVTERMSVHFLLNLNCSGLTEASRAFSGGRRGLGNWLHIFSSRDENKEFLCRGEGLPCKLSHIESVIGEKLAWFAIRE